MRGAVRARCVAAATSLLLAVGLAACNAELAPARPFPDPPPGTVPAALTPTPPRRGQPEVGWTLLGGRLIDGQSDRELFVIVDGPDCEDIRIAVTRGQAEVTSFGVSFADGERFVPHGPMVFDALHREHVLHIPGGHRQVSQVDFRIRRLAAEPLEVAVSGR